jgi:hypothetical protein
MKTKIDLSDIVRDALKFCKEGFGGLLIVSGNEEEISLLRRNFLDSCESKYPVKLISREQYTAGRNSSVIEGKNYYQVRLDEIELGIDE